MVEEEILRDRRENKMVFLYGFISGAIIGVIVGIIILSLVSVNKD